MMRRSGPLIRLAAGLAEAAMTWTRCDAVIAVSQAEVATARRWGLPKGRLHLVPNGVAPAPSTDRSAARSALGVADDALVVGFVGRLCPRKILCVSSRPSDCPRPPIPALSASSSATAR